MKRWQWYVGLFALVAVLTLTALPAAAQAPWSLPDWQKMFPWGQGRPTMMPEDWLPPEWLSPDLLIERLADAYGMPVDELREQLQEGKSPGELAEELDVDMGEIIDELHGNLDIIMARLVSAGLLTQEQADEFKYYEPDIPAMPDLPNVPRIITPWVEDEVALLAEALDMDAEDVKDALDDGQSVLDLAREARMTPEALRQALRVARDKQVEAAYDKGDLSGAEADWLLFGEGLPLRLRIPDAPGLDLRWRFGR